MASEGRNTLLDVPTIIFGFALGFSILTLSTAGQQTISIYKRRKTVFTSYLALVWAEVTACLVLAVIIWMFLKGDIKGSLGFYIVVLSFWTVQTQCSIQIVCNRVALVMPTQSQARRLKWIMFVIVGLVNISVFCIWIPARMNVSQTFIDVNKIWDRIGKVIYLVLDLGLNIYFLYLVRSRLIAQGLHKYQALFKFNAAIITISIAMDVLIIGAMSLPNDLIYTQFHPLAYLVKLKIELSMADLISKVVRGKDRTDKPISSSDPHSKSGPHGGTTRRNDLQSGTAFQLSTQAKGNAIEATTTKVVSDDEPSSASSSISGVNFAIQGNGIMKTVDVDVERTAGRRESTSSSTAQLYNYTQGLKD